MSFVKEADETATLWRYMDLSKFLDLLLHKHLVLPRYDKFEDTYEGYSANFEELMVRGVLANISEETGQLYDDDTIQLTINTFSDYIKINNFYSYISCWHLNEFESAGMWKLYCTTNESIAIKTSVKSLADSITFDSDFDTIFSKITYGSEISEKDLFKAIKETSTFSSLLMKRESFEHEKEYRIICVNSKEAAKTCIKHEGKFQAEFDEFVRICYEEINQIEFDLKKNPNKSVKIKLLKRLDEIAALRYEDKENRLDYLINELKGNTPLKKLEVDIESLIDEIIISPHAPNWFVDTVRKLVKDLGYGFQVTKSDLYTLK